MGQDVEAFVYPANTPDRDIELWEIAENLHRAELTALERDEQVAEWIRLVAEKAPTNKLTQVVSVSKGGRGNAGGIRQASRDLGINREDARRAVKVASLSLDAKAAAKAHKLDNNRDALLAAAKYREPAKQVEAIKQIATTPKDHDAAAVAHRRERPENSRHNGLTPRAAACYAAEIDWRESRPRHARNAELRGGVLASRLNVPVPLADR